MAFFTFLYLPFNSGQAVKCSRIAPPGHKQEATSGPKYNTHGQKYDAHGQQYDAMDKNMTEMDKKKLPRYSIVCSLA